LLALQRSVGNQAMQRLMRSPGIQAKLKISQPGDQFEREADNVASTVMKSPMPPPGQEASPDLNISRIAGTTAQREDAPPEMGSREPAVQRYSRSSLRQHPQPDEEFEESGSPLRQHPQS